MRERARALRHARVFSEILVHDALFLEYSLESLPSTERARSRIAGVIVSDHATFALPISTTAAAASGMVVAIVALHSAATRKTRCGSISMTIGRACTRDSLSRTK